MLTLARYPVFVNSAHAHALALQLQYVGPHEPPKQLLDLIVKVTSPFFAYASTCTQPCAGAPIHRKTKQDLARRLVRFLSDGAYQHPFYSGLVATMSDTLLFLWTYIDVDVDLYGWQDRFPFVGLFDKILASMPQNALGQLQRVAPFCKAGVRQPYRSETLGRYLQHYALHRAADDAVPRPERIMRSEAAEAHAIRATRHRFLRRRWALAQVLWRRSVPWALVHVADLLWGCVSWLGVLERAEA